MNLFMPAERVLYDRAYYLSDEAEKDYAFEVAEEHGVDVGEVLYSDELMKEVRDALDRDIDLYLDDEIANFDSMLRELKCGDDPEHPAEISVVAMGSVGRWDVPSRGLVAANSLRDLIDGKGSADALVDCQIDRIVDTNGTFTVKPGTYEPIFGIYDPVGGCGGTMGTVLDRDFEIDPHDISYTMMEPVSGEWKSDRIDLYTPQDCFGFSDPFGGRIEYSEKKPKAVVAVKPDPVELGHRASVAASSTVGDRARGAGIRQ